MVKNPSPFFKVFFQNPAEIWSNVSTQCETRETSWKCSVVMFAMLKGVSLNSEVPCVRCVYRDLRGTWEESYMSCKLPFQSEPIPEVSTSFSMSKAGVGIITRVSISRSGSFSHTPKEPTFPDAEPSWIYGDHRCLGKGQNLSENVIQGGSKISSKSTRIMAGD